MANLSPAAQAVLDAATASAIQNLHGTYERDIAAALRAAADQVFPIERTSWGSTLIPVLTARESRDRLLAIAAELEGADG